VQSNEEQYMTKDERVVLEEWEEKRVKLEVLMMRVDESVFVLRDMARDGWSGDDPFVPHE